MCAPRTSVTSMRSAGPSPRSAATVSNTSTAFPQARPSGWFMSVITAAIALPMRFPIDTMDCASARASSRVFMNAPVPHFTSSTRASVFSASFLDMMLAEMSGIEGTVPVTSRNA